MTTAIIAPPPAMPRGIKGAIARFKAALRLLSPAQAAIVSTLLIVIGPVTATLVLAGFTRWNNKH